MDIEQKSRNDVTILVLSGKFDIEQAETFERLFAEAITSKPKNVALDVHGLSFIDSSGMGAMIKALNNVKNYGGQMILFGLKPMILNVFKLAKLDNFFKIMSAEEFDSAFPG